MNEEQPFCIQNNHQLNVDSLDFLDEQRIDDSLSIEEVGPHIPKIGEM